MSACKTAVVSLRLDCAVAKPEARAFVDATFPAFATSRVGFAKCKLVAEPLTIATTLLPSLFVPVGTNAEIADHAAGILRGTSLTDVRTRAPSLFIVGQVDEFYQANLTVPYYADYLD